MDELEKVKQDLEQLKEDVEDIRDNHLASIEVYLLALDKEVYNLRWFVLGAGGVIGIVLALLQVWG